MQNVEADDDLDAQRILTAENLCRHRRRRGAHDLSEYRRSKARVLTDERNSAKGKPRGLGIELALAPRVRQGRLPRLIEQRRGIGMQIFDAADIGRASG